MILKDLHVHTAYCDGKNTPEEIVLAAIEKKMDCIGFSGHSYTFFDESYCMSKADTEKYKAEITDLKEKYKGKIEILCGIEQDYYSHMPTDDYDYVIGSVHYVKTGGEYIPVDENAEIIKAAVYKHYNGDIYGFTEDYFKTVSDVVTKTKCSIIGHFDLITKFNEMEKLFDENNPRYVAAYERAVDALVKHNVPFEINTGAISRGYKTAPYPSSAILDYIKQCGGKVILSSDSHSKDTLCYEFDKWRNIGEGLLFGYAGPYK